MDKDNKINNKIKGIGSDAEKKATKKKDKEALDFQLKKALEENERFKIYLSKINNTDIL